MRTVNYDLYAGNTKMVTTTNFDRALEWKSMRPDHTYKVRLETVQQVITEAEKEWRKSFIEKHGKTLK